MPTSPQEDGVPADEALFDVDTPDQMAGDQYPPDAVGDEDQDPTVSGPGIPQVRSTQVRQNALKARPPRSVKQAKRVKKRSSRIISKEKQRKALELRKTGASYEQIAHFVGYKDQSGARKAVVRAFNQVIQEPVTELRTLQVERLNHMLMTLWPKVQQGDETAINTTLRVMDKMDALQGTEQAQSVQVQQNNSILVVDGNKDDFINAARKMAGLGIQHDGTNFAAQQAALPTAPGTKYPPGMGQTTAQQLDEALAGPVGQMPHLHSPSDTPDIVDGEVLEDATVIASGDRNQPDPVRTPDTKKFHFGVEPTVTRGGSSR